MTESTTLIEGPVKRVSLVASGFVNERHFVLKELSQAQSFKLFSYRSPDDESPSKTWKITYNTNVSPSIASSSFKVRGKDESSPLKFLAALAKSKSFKQVQLFYFNVTFPDDYSLPWSNDKLTLCFEDEAIADKWRKTIEEVIRTCNLHKTSIDKRKRQQLEHESSDAAAVLSTLPSGQLSNLDSSTVGKAADGAAGSAPAAAGEATAPRAAAPRSWQSVNHVNGVAVYAEDEGEEGEGGAFMASVVVRAPPKVCFQALMKASAIGSGSAGEIPFTDSVVLLETIDAHTQVVKHLWMPERGLGRWIAAPREVVALRTWRQELDGTYIVLYQSTSHRKARQEGSGKWGGPVRAKLQAAGFTISPLLPQYVPGGGPSQECLVTLVVKADLAGYLSPTSLLSRIAPAVADAARWRVLGPLLMSVVALRDRVEQRRFVVMPYTMSAEGDDIVEEEAAAREASPQRPKSPIFQRTTTSLTEAAAASLSAVKRPLPPVVEEAFSDAVSEGAEVATSGITPSAVFSPALSPRMSRIATRAHPATPQKEDLPIPEEEAWAVGGTTPSRFWSYPGSSNLKIRGPDYLNDRVKIPASLPIFDLYASDLVDSDEPLWDIAKSLPSMKHCKAPFAFVLNLIYPANGMLQSLVTTWTAPVDVFAMDEDALVEYWGEDEEGTVRSFFRNFKPWIQGDGEEADKRRNIKFKLIPRVAQGSWVVRQSVGTTPVLLGQKLKTKYFRGRSAGGCNYFECDVDITSNTVANSVTRLVVNSITSLVVDLAPLVEGQAPDELPERLLGSVRYDHLDLRTSSVWDEDKQVVCQRPGSAR